MIFVTPWDDGDPFDERLADLLFKWGIKGTFYIPIRNSEGRKVISPAAIRTLDKMHEVASHTLDHLYLNKLTLNACKKQIEEGKNVLESILGHEVAGFCYPGGLWNSGIRDMVIAAGFSHARTTKNLCLKKNNDRFLLPTTFQFYPHKKSTLIWNYLKNNDYYDRCTALRMLTSTGTWLENALALLTSRSETDDIIHLWGHSWEIDSLNLWSELDTFLAFVASLKPRNCNVGELVDL